MQKIRAAIALIPHGGKYDHITIENTGFVSSITRHITIEALHKQIQKLFISRKFCGSSCAK